MNNPNYYQIYEDPLTKDKLEGVARIKEIIRQDIGTVEKHKLILAYVEFKDDPGNEYIRTVDCNDKI